MPRPLCAAPWPLSPRGRSRSRCGQPCCRPPSSSGALPCLKHVVLDACSLFAGAWWLRHGAPAATSCMRCLDDASAPWPLPRPLHRTQHVCINPPRLRIGADKRKAWQVVSSHCEGQVRAAFVALPLTPAPSQSSHNALLPATLRPPAIRPSATCVTCLALLPDGHILMAPSRCTTEHAPPVSAWRLGTTPSHPNAPPTLQEAPSKPGLARPLYSGGFLEISGDDALPARPRRASRLPAALLSSRCGLFAILVTKWHQPRVLSGSHMGCEVQLMRTFGADALLPSSNAFCRAVRAATAGPGDEGVAAVDAWELATAAAAGLAMQREGSCQQELAYDSEVGPRSRGPCARLHVAPHHVSL
jgi:hypothetical protein